MTESSTHASGPLGSVTREGETVILDYERELAHPPEKAWRAITESEHLRQWFPVDIIGERATGASLRLTFWPEALAGEATSFYDEGLATSLESTYSEIV